ncbi:Fur family transcriptional regulator [Mycobacterium aquaticum]|uniref:Fe2+/Zn2+ uptake regulation protein n=1 Tax=Mycobacterium aquaticum TaxID=1927124 RepID=A0A1X0A8L5_9MYCO|nr:transcriptional repressor [Mycobacterium aquaticum]ORA26036.1 Fe2+/Zn2+ uptake regulation protein [Mycobacterium aquaticum]
MIAHTSGETAPASRRRQTAAQRAVLSVLDSSEHFRSAQQLYRQLRQHPTHQFGLTTVYRVLRTLVEDKIAEIQRAEDGELLYRIRTTNEHRHYLLCRQCGRAEAFTSTPIEDQTRQLSRTFDYTDVTHHVDLYGVCPRCRDT